MMVEGLTDAIVAFVRHHSLAMIALLFALAFFESIVITSWLIPATVIFTALGTIAGANDGMLIIPIIAGTLGGFCGDITSYLIGRRISGSIRNMWPINKHPGVLMRAEDIFNRQGLIALLIAKFAGPLRPIVPMLAGTSRHRLDHFAAASILSSLIWCAAVLVPTYYGGKVITG